MKKKTERKPSKWLQMKKKKRILEESVKLYKYYADKKCWKTLVSN